MQIGAVRNDLLLWNRRWQPVFVPVESHALADLDPIEHSLVGHRPPTDRKINRHQLRFPVEPVSLPMQDPRIDRKASERFQMILAMLDHLVSAVDCNLRWFR